MKRSPMVQLAQLVDMQSPAAVFEEVKYNFIRNYRIEDFEDVRAAFRDFNDLFEGKYPGYRACNTKFHDKIHTTDALLAISRLIDGYNIVNRPFPAKCVKTALIATIFHDTGYLQRSQDKKGTGAKYTLNHVERSMEFIGHYYKKMGFPAGEAASGQKMVQCTGLNTKLTDIVFEDQHEKILGFMLGTADLIGQMASRTYLERLLHLYKEFKEGNVKGYDSEYQLLEKTKNFQAIMKIRLQDDLLGLNNYVRVHFKERYRIDENLYDKAIQNEIDYLNRILPDRKTYREKIRRRL